ncbi:MAG: hypothetical protein JRH16_15860 [Deltaproteobacteria bacterium]|nr:hypothetical protein [Deltaproteobacteria bacterium]MBW2362113.1 hypothetical protein [Deltaproteobacteria bacterium]
MGTRQICRPCRTSRSESGLRTCRRRGRWACSPCRCRNRRARTRSGARASGAGSICP